MLVDNNKMTAVHCTLLVKVVRAVSEEQFSEHFAKQDFPRIRMSPAESKIKESFWPDCTAVLLDRGILQPATSSAKLVA